MAPARKCSSVDRRAAAAAAPVVAPVVDVPAPVSPETAPLDLNSVSDADLAARYAIQSEPEEPQVEIVRDEPAAPSADAPYTNCVEGLVGDPAFVLDVDRNGMNEMVVPVRRGPNEEFFREPDYSTELKALGFPIGSPSTIRARSPSSI